MSLPLLPQLPLSPTRVEAIRGAVQTELRVEQIQAEQDQTRARRRIAALTDERTKLLTAHYTGTVPLQTLKVEITRLTRETTDTAQQHHPESGDRPTNACQSALPAPRRQRRARRTDRTLCATARRRPALQRQQHPGSPDRRVSRQAEQHTGRHSSTAPAHGAAHHHRCYQAHKAPSRSAGARFARRPSGAHGGSRTPTAALKRPGTQGSNMP
jgi:hypothetical protein